MQGEGEKGRDDRKTDTEEGEKGRRRRRMQRTDCGKHK